MDFPTLTLNPELFFHDISPSIWSESRTSWFLQRGQKPGAETNGNSSCGAPLQLMKTSFPNKPGKHQRMNMGMEVEQAAVGLHTEDPDAQAISELQAFTKVFSPGLPCAAQQ